MGLGGAGRWACAAAPFDSCASRSAAASWVALYLAFVLAPLFALLIGPLPPSRDFWTEFSIAIGYSGLAMMGLQFGLTARFRYVTAPWGEDVIYHLHRQISLLAVALVVAHPLILFAVRPELMALLNSFTAPCAPGSPRFRPIL